MTIERRHQISRKLLQKRCDEIILLWFGLFIYLYNQNANFIVLVQFLLYLCMNGSFGRVKLVPSRLGNFKYWVQQILWFV
jgi:hypothetical protein